MSNQKYTPSNQTNIEKHWIEELGYVRASEQPDIKAKHDMYKTYGYDINKASVCQYTGNGQTVCN
jgi:hypothetical protein